MSATSDVMAKMKHLVVFSLFIWILLFKYTESKYIEGRLQTAEDWSFLARFCFLSERGRLQFEFEYPQENYEPQNILLYFDDQDQWPSVYKSDKNCTARESYPHIKPENNQKIILHKDQFWSGCKHTVNNITKHKIVKCEAGRSFRSSRERWWFIAASRCIPKGGVPGLMLDYKMWMTNGDGFFFRHFSADEFYILQVDIAFMLIIGCIFVASIIVAVLLRKRQLFHTTYKMYMTALVLEVLHLLFMCIAYGKYAENGKDDYGLKVTARLFEAAGLLVFLLMLILMAKGYTITRGRLSTSGSIKIAVFMTLYAITYAVLFIYEANFFDPGEVLYIYESPPGYGLIALRLLGWIWFCYATFFTIKHYPEKSAFYYPFFIFYTIWFWGGIIAIFVANFGIPKWMREKVVSGVMHSITFVGFVFFLILSRPSASNKNFPYHVRTTQIGIMNTPATQNGVPLTASKESDSFGSHPYAPSAPETTVNGAPNFAELFTVSNTRSQQNGTVDKFPHQKENPFIVSQ